MKLHNVVENYHTREEAQAAIRKLGQDGFDIQKLAIVAKGNQTEDLVAGFYTLGDRASSWAKKAALVGGLWGFFAGTIYMNYPQAALWQIAGPYIDTLFNVAAGMAAGAALAAIAAVLYTVAIKGERDLKFQTVAVADAYLVIVHGTDQEVAEARSLLERESWAEIAA